MAVRKKRPILLILAAFPALGSPPAAKSEHVYKLQLSTCSGHNVPSIHGLWPEWDQYCDGSVYNHDALKDLIPEMQDDWYSCGGHSGDDWFWEHEWQRHGRCAVKTGEFHTEHDYFKKVLDLYEGGYKQKCVDELAEREKRGKNVGYKQCSWCLEAFTWREVKCPPWPPPRPRSSWFGGIFGRFVKGLRQSVHDAKYLLSGDHPHSEIEEVYA